MVQAARSGTQNIAEGYQQASLEGYIKLVGINAASLEELLKDYLAYARQNGLEIWSKDKGVREIREVGEVWGIIRKTLVLPDHPNFPDLPDYPTKAVNLMVTLVNQAIYLQKKLRLSLERKFINEGGFRENLFKRRLDRKQERG
jgi:four helix bundle suffix protein